jgi:hypothetical protein
MIPDAPPLVTSTVEEVLDEISFLKEGGLLALA